ncbi:MAG: PqiC family protein [Candidatus Protistobacter heckmanni]|nr:PqiC family protein [Candidatus Protistobacter heckmanni]
MRAWLRRLALALVLGGSAAALAPGLAGCQSAAPARPVGNYDFGPLPVETLGKARFQGGLRLSGVLAPLWMEASDLNYRLLYSDANQPRAYATSRWVMPAPQLVASRLRAAISRRGQLVAASDLVEAPSLRVELEEFSQAFDSPTASRGAISMRATVIKGRTMLAQKVFSLSVPAETADAVGGAHALAKGVDVLIEQIMDWVVALPLF